MLSGVSFLVGFLLIRYGSDTDYGMFVVVQATILLLTCAQSAWLSGPLAVLAPKMPAQERREMVGAIKLSQRRFVRQLALLALTVPAIGYALGAWNDLVACVVAGAVLAGWAALQRDYLRALLLMYSRPQAVLRADFIYVLVFLSAALIAAFGPGPAVIWAVGGLVAAAWAGGIVANRSLATDPGWVAGDASEYWRKLRPMGVWSTSGALIYWLYTQSYNYVLASQINLTAVADVNAARLLLMPAMVLTAGITGMMIPSAAIWLAEFGLRRLLRRLSIFFVCIAALDLIYIALVWVFRDWLSGDLLRKTIGDRDRLLLLWALVALIGLTRDMFGCAMAALGLFKPMARLSAACAVLSLSLIWFGLSRWGPAAALIGQIAGETLNLAGFAFLLWRADRRAPTPVDPGRGSGQPSL